jgi:uncharacterized membrane protein YbhN (UPF0104 family)
MGLNKALGWAVGAASSVGSAWPWAGAGALQVVTPFVFRLAVTTIIFLLIFWEIGFRSILGRLQDLQPVPLALVALVLGIQFLVTAWRWKRIADSVGPSPVPYSAICRAQGAGNLYGQLLPSTLGDDVVRIAMLARRIGAAPATFSVLVDRMAGLAVLLGLMIALLPLLGWRIGHSTVVLAGLMLGLAGLGALFFFLFLPDRLPSRWTPRIVASLSSLAAHVRKALFTSALAPAVIGGGILTQLSSIAVVFLLGQAVGIPVSIADCLLLVPWALLLAGLPVSLAGWGVREGAMASVFTLVGVHAADSVTMSILYGLTAPTVGLVYGMFALFERPRSLSWRVSRAEKAKSSGGGEN